MTKIDFFDDFWTGKSTFLNIRTHLYRGIFWRRFLKWIYFSKKWTPKVWNGVFCRKLSQKGPFFTYFRLLGRFYPPNVKNKVIFEFLVKKYVDIGGSKYSKIRIFRFKKRRKKSFFGHFNEKWTFSTVLSPKTHIFENSGQLIPTYFLTRNSKMTLFFTFCG